MDTSPQKSRARVRAHSFCRHEHCVQSLAIPCVLCRRTFREHAGALEFAQASEMLVPAVASAAVATDVHERVLAAVAGGCEG